MLKTVLKWIFHICNSSHVSDHILGLYPKYLGSSLNICNRLNVSEHIPRLLTLKYLEQVTCVRTHPWILLPHRVHSNEDPLAMCLTLLQLTELLVEMFAAAGSAVGGNVDQDQSGHVSDGWILLRC